MSKRVQEPIPELGLESTAQALFQELPVAGKELVLAPREARGVDREIPPEIQCRGGGEEVDAVECLDRSLVGMRERGHVGIAGL